MAKVPKRETKCKVCGKRVQVRSVQSYFPFSVMTTGEAALVDALSALAAFGIAADDAKAEEARLSHLFGFPAPSQDVAWALYQLAIQRGAGRNVYLASANHLEREDRDPFELMQAFFRLKIMEWKDSDIVVGVEVLLSGDPCDACRAQAGRVFTIEEALRLMPIPCVKCKNKIHPSHAHGRCRCTLGAVFKEPNPYEDTDGEWPFTVDVEIR